uniref:Odorant receptor n=1 Tax=Eucryptorrhynchus scrobiculatus TaxID=1552824 RepID=A0A8F4RTA5_EUCSC|nr:odorant receptor 31 [Eucryptorrhynchus scrobiculatus]
MLILENRILEAMDEPKGKEKPQNTWRSSISITEKLMTLAAIWPMEKTTIFQGIKIVIFGVAVVLFNVSSVVELRNLLMKGDYEVLSTHLPTFGPYLGYLSKIIIFLFKRREFRKMLEIMESPIFEDYSPEMQKYKDKCIVVSNKIATFYSSCVGASVFLYLAKPLYTEFNLPMNFSYKLSLGPYLLVLAWQCFSSYYLVMTGVCFGLITLGLMNVATAQLDILSKTITSFKPKNMTLSEKEEQCFLRKCAKKHQTIISFVAEIENVFSFLFLAQCLASVASICNGAFQLTHTEDILSIRFLFNCAFAFDVLFEIGICFWFGNLLTIKSLQVSDACFNYEWVNSSTSTKKILLIILTQSQRPLYLTVGRFARLSMTSYLMILKTAYSYFALMQSLYDNQAL